MSSDVSSLRSDTSVPVSAPTRAEGPNWQRFAFLTVLVIVTVAVRLLPHPRNVTPIGAVALFGGATLASPVAALGVTLTALFVSDLFVGLHFLMLPVYACFLFNVWLGRRLGAKPGPVRIAGGTLIGSVVFFVVTNFATWLAFYEPTAAGLATCYLRGLPDFVNTIAGDLFFSGLLFGALSLAEGRFPVLRPLPSAAAAPAAA
ncbi:DUF6580 family putative transport protein [Planctomyces sp. SH-PL14]|uniref:DUF6580 family putative transport protein n=1 Tax=Planctomyces sp. SH-PL14 TaxID=1632864 RepID=UPI00078D618A|nr:DUF6580 family putative transport protein [Planctomyces sp. SH-PL14]AMV19407.1 hypothetical protein VT03_16055 [Planctomyces sp. SH-PL14]